MEHKVNRRLRQSIATRCAASALLLAVASVGALVAAACGRGDSSSEAVFDPTSADAPMPLLAGANDLVCPPGSTLDTAGYKLCVEKNSSVGPFSFGMKQKCRTNGGGLACDKSVWALGFARNIRTTSACPPGATLSARGVCTEGTLAFGPFTQAHVDNCIKQSGGSVCTDSLRWDAKFAESTSPIPRPRANLPWKWISGRDHGLRTDGCGAGDFRASRGGGTRVHKGIDVLLPIGANLYSPCAGTVETGYEGAGYGYYAIVTCKVPDVIAGGTSAYVSMLYGHLSRVSVGNGLGVGAGQKVGEVGKTGNANAGCVNPHVHFEATVESTAFRALNAMPRSMAQSEARDVAFEASEALNSKEGVGAVGGDAHGLFGNVRTLADKLAVNCMNPFGFKAPGGLTYGNVIDPFVLLTCLSGNKPTLQRSSLQSIWWPWSSFYAARAFNVNVGRR